MRYPGGKNNNGSYQRIISEMPFHTEYIEGFAGSGAVFRYKLPAMRSTLIDRDECALSMLQQSMSAGSMGSVDYVAGDCLEYLGSRVYDGQQLIYLDPPYLFSSRRSMGAGIYKFEFGTEQEHARLLDLVRSINACVLISGYQSDLYAAMLQGWRVVSWRVGTRRGVATEYLWCNFPVPAMLHDSRYVGSSFTERQRLRRLSGLEARFSSIRSASASIIDGQLSFLGGL